MYVRAGISVSSILDRTQKDFLFGMGPIAAAAILILLSSVLLSKRFVLDKVAALREATERISRGDLSARVPEIVSGGELGELGGLFRQHGLQAPGGRTERQEAVKELRESEIRPRSYSILGRRDSRHHRPGRKILYRFQHQACERTTGLRREEFGGRRFPTSSSLAAHRKKRSPTHTWETISCRIRPEFEGRHRTKHGEQRRIHVKDATISSVFDATGKIRHTTAIWRDITESKLPKPRRKSFRRSSSRR